MSAAKSPRNKRTIVAKSKNLYQYSFLVIWLTITLVLLVCSSVFTTFSFALVIMSLCSRSSRFASTTYPWVSMATPLIRSTWLLWLFSLSTPSNSFSLLLPFNCMFWPLRNLLCLLGYLLLWSWNWCSLLQLRSQVFLLLWSISSSLIRMTACSLSFFAYSNSYLMDLISSTSLPFVSTRKAISKQKIARTLRSVIAISF